MPVAGRGKDRDRALGGTLLDLTQDQVLHSIKADRAHLQGLLYRGVQVLHAEAFQQAQNLHRLATADLQHPRLHQAAQRIELLGQAPFRERCGLIQSIDLAFDQRELVDRVEHHVLARVAPRMARDHVPAAANHHVVGIDPQPDILMAIGHGDRVIVGVVADQRLGTHPAAGLCAGLIGGGW